jgi:hypothetical protein
MEATMGIKPMKFKSRFIKFRLSGYSCSIGVIAIGLTLNLFGSTSLAGTTVDASNPTKVQDLPACYVQTTTGKVIDLSKKCGFVQPAICGTSLGSASRDAVLADFCRKNQRCALTNTCNTMPRGIQAPPPGTPMG